MNAVSMQKPKEGKVLESHGLAALTFTLHWFDGSVVHEDEMYVEKFSVWRELHEFERAGLLAQWLQQAGFDKQQTFSSRGWPRPQTDPHSGETGVSDPVYAVWGFKPAESSAGTG